MGLVRRTGDDLQRIVIESLTQGNELSQRVLDLVDISAGEAITFVPASARELSWERGGVLSRQQMGAEHMRLLLTEAATATFSIAVGENSVIKASDKKLLGEIPNAISISGNDVYEWTPDQHELRAFLGGLSNPWPGAHCFLVDGVSELTTAIDPTVFDTLARNVVGIIVEAFDAEGFVLWKRAA